jgi:hypothetical protein
MKLAMKVGTAGITALALSGAIAGTAVAASNTSPQPAAVHATASEPTGPDTDAIRQGDQTSPDTGTVAVTTADNSAGPREQDTSAEQQTPSDGPGGHADPAGNIQHEFNGVE